MAMRSDIEERRRKLEQLKNMRSKTNMTLLSDYSSIQSKNDIELKVESIIQEKSKQQLVQEEKKFNERRELVKKNLVYQNTKDLIISKQPLYDQEVQVQLEVVYQQSKKEEEIEQTNELKEAELQLTQNLLQNTLNKPVKNDKITQEEISQIYTSQNFQDFLNHSSKLIEKSLQNDILDLESEFQKHNKQENDNDIYNLQFFSKFYDQQFTQRVVVDIDVSKMIEGLVCVAYSEKQVYTINDSIGLAAIWSESLQTRPEFICHSSSPINLAKFHPFQQPLVVGGLQNGQIVIWDLRTRSQPVQKSGMLGQAHVLPITGLQIVGSNNSYNIISMSNDGKICNWNQQNISQPASIIQLTQKEELIPTCLLFGENESNQFYVGSEEGIIYSSQLHQSEKEPIIEIFKSHQSVITSLSMNNPKSISHSTLNGLLLSSSFDWSSKLWAPKLSANPIMSFEHSEGNIYDCQWHNVNPKLFSTCNNEGQIDIWDLAQDLEFPVYSHTMQKHVAFNKIRWSKDGKHLYAGNTEGELQIFKASKQIYKPYNQEIEKAQENIRKETTRTNKKDKFNQILQI